MHIVADIGGTNARFAQIDLHDGKLHNIEIYACADFVSFEEAIKAYISHRGEVAISNVCAAVAAPVVGDWIDMPNNHWEFSRQQLQNSLGLPVNVINDFSAQMLAVDAIPSKELHWIGAPRPYGNGVKAVLGPGTGLGISMLMPGGQPLPSEGGHVAFAPTNQHQIDLLTVLWQRFGRVSIERLLSGMGLANLYWANCQLAGVDSSKTPEEVTQGVLDGDEYCIVALEDFFTILAEYAGDVALMAGAEGGVYLSGGILPQVKNFLNEDLFRQRFEAKARYSKYCETIPLAIALAEYPGLQGCVQFLKR